MADLPERPIPALLLAAGLGTRLAPLTDDVPKCLVPIHARPLLGYWLDLLGNFGMDPLVVNLHHHAEAVREFLAGNIWRDRVHAVYEEKLLGTGGTLLARRDLLGGGTFFVAHADNLSRFRVADFVQAHRNRPAGCIMTMMLFRTPTPETCGIVELDEKGIVVAFHEKAEHPPGNLANAAVYLMEPEVFAILEKSGEKTPDLSLDLAPHCLGEIFTWINNDYHRDIGTPESYHAAQSDFSPTGKPL